jgi:hypothetical protein
MGIKPPVQPRDSVAVLPHKGVDQISIQGFSHITSPVGVPAALA